MPRLRTIHMACLLALSHVPTASASDRSTVAASPQIGTHAATEFSATRRQAVGSTSRACLPSALKDVLASIESRYGPVRVISTHRPGARIAGTSHPSLHATCRAVDFHPAPGKYREVLAYLNSHWNGGIGTYSGQLHHLHVDVGHRKRWHTYAAGAGQWPRLLHAKAQSTTSGTNLH
jgi:uncharacterized protein YcbK (DUF882 family)